MRGLLWLMSGWKASPWTVDEVAGVRPTAQRSGVGGWILTGGLPSPPLDGGSGGSRAPNGHAVSIGDHASMLSIRSHRVDHGESFPCR